jgi:hypothetical protein
MSTPASEHARNVRIQPRSRSGLASNRSAAPSSPAPGFKLSDFAEECFQLTVEALLQFGFSREQSREAMSRALDLRKRTMPGTEAVRRYHQLSGMINTWRRDKRFLNLDGSPKVIPIRGRGASFETLAEKHAPRVPIKTLVDDLCRYGDVTRSSKNTLALVGSNVLLYQRTPEMGMATLNDNMRTLISTTLYNFSLPPEEKVGGNFQRVVRGCLTTKNYRKFAKYIRPQLQELCDLVDRDIDKGLGPRRNRRQCGMSIYLFQEPE